MAFGLLNYVEFFTVFTLFKTQLLNNLDQIKTKNILPGKMGHGKTDAFL